ncbi:penicillin-binding protein [Candidatus Roizmanbacteria bacterium CG_4_10_14_0_8_um_filter_36_36]|uniref:Penicillin-binding protein n=2 Tax=Candidatus Roizmaniibacteriota TaxID=1752723 RepID=A0A2M8KJX8_9BACT|nr:MAG: penicillin-binding protein [Candidatus Roizmanbacteria bacterium CG03_land_8_20_14_0_80_36_21]PIY69753.1 MAG: penicillin-binding protein [Candidatus Roizmanbacteria bacterium CG_4_10_14_0_8_um_filter_36_36]PJC82166.1 MAG: penicillin-binding protein [Candidatus Roizmanbacteria bacterium CG_4_8_14_3_um_filter_36_10]PJE60211.1 MAG: penicillin-binding protein [Candidatus Roizmanbacteria bacterium CG10_big_fil_rev_8_21_14_0_10_36_26]
MFLMVENVEKKIKPVSKSFVIKLVIFIGIGYFVFSIFYKLPNPASLKEYKVVPLSTHILDRNGKLLYEIYREQSRTAIKLDQLPKYVAQATIAIEDKDFYKHGGVSLFGGMLRAIKDTVLRQKLQGGSTITQQLIKSALLTPERTIRRKIREIILALWTERIFSKNEILEMYLNQVPYGGAAYGVEEAAKIYFSKHAKELTLSEAALLAGLPQAPSIYSPFYNPDLAKERRNSVLKTMYTAKYIDKNTYEKETQKVLKINPPKTSINAPHFVFYVKYQLEQVYSLQQIEEEGLKVTTTLNLEVQKQAENILKNELEKIKELDVTNGAILVTRPPTGEILSMIGSVDYFATASGAFNVATALRQPGSSIKPLNYAVGLDRKLVTPATVFLDVPTCFLAAGQPKTYCPVNYDGQFHGPTQLRFTLGNSYNIPAVKMLAYNGVENFIASASAFTISTFKDPKKYGLSLTLGGGEVKMTEMAQAFSAFANRGIAKKLVSILKIEDKNGKVLYRLKDPNLIKDVKKSLPSPNFFAITGSKAISQETAFLISHILLDNNARSAAFGDHSYLIIPNKAVSVKTGTTDDKKDNWTIGFTPNFLTAVWVGNNDNTPMNPYLTSGVTGAAPIWNQVMSYVLKNQSDLWPVRPADVVGKQVCWDNGTLAEKKEDGSESCQSRFEYFIKGTEPISSVTMKELLPINRDSGRLTQVDDPNIELQEKTVIKDMFSIYCVDCNHEGEQQQTIKL